MPETHATLAEVLADLGSWRQAVQEAETALELDSRNFDAIRILGYSYEVQGKYTEALAYYEQAAALEPNLPFIYLIMGRNYRALDNFDEAIGMFRRGLHRCARRSLAAL